MYSKYNPKYHDDWAWSLAIKGADEQEIADAFHVSRATINNWKYTTDENGKRVLTSFGESLMAGKEAADAKVERCLYEKSTGYEYEETKITMRRNAKGNEVVDKKEITKKKAPPDTMAMMYWLNNRKRDTGEWAQRQEVKLGADDSLAQVRIYLPDNGRDKPEEDE